MKTPIFVGILTAALLVNNSNTAFGIAEGLSCPTANGGQINSACQPHEPENHSRQISQTLFDELQELARLVDVSYCVGSTGLREPFDCLNHCKEFEGFELVTTWNTGLLLSDSCGYIALSHEPFAKRIVVAFRGTYSIVNTIADLSLIPQKYVPYPAGDGDDEGHENQDLDHGHHLTETKCTNCTVHAGFLTSWRNTRDFILPHLEDASQRYPDYKLILIGHSLGGAVAALAGLDLKLRGWDPTITTFGEPRIGNRELAKFVDAVFDLDGEGQDSPTWTAPLRESSFRRVTHVGDPIPLLPLAEWGYCMHAGEIFIAKPELSPSQEDVQFCVGDADKDCIAGSDSDEVTRLWPFDTDFSNMLQPLDFDEPVKTPDGKREAGGIDHDNIAISNQRQVFLGFHEQLPGDDEQVDTDKVEAQWSLIPARYRLWELFHSHRDYFSRIGLCFPSQESA